MSDTLRHSSKEFSSLLSFSDNDIRQLISTKNVRCTSFLGTITLAQELDQVTDLKGGGSIPGSP